MTILQAEVEVLDVPQVETLRAMDGQSMTLLFQRLEVTLGETPAPLATRTTSFRIPVSANPGGADLCLLLRGRATLTVGGRGLLLVYQGRDRLLLELPPPPCRCQEFRQRLQTRLAPGEDCRLTLFLLVEGPADGPGQALGLSLESLDIRVLERGLSAPAHPPRTAAPPTPWSPPPAAWPPATR